MCRLCFRFGDGYTVILRLASTKPPENPCPVDVYIKNSFPGIELKERHQSVLQYQLPSHICSIARVFDVLSNNHEELGIADYSVSQTTLDQVTSGSKELVLEFFLVFLEGLGWLRGSSMGVCAALCDMLACRKGYTNTF